jgi:quercetin dioxygenase-like cupin family protein
VIREMKMMHYKDVPPDPAGEEGASDIMIRWLITERDGAPNFSMRVIEIGPGGYSPFHRHPWEHEVFVLDGCGVLVQENQATPFDKGDVIFVPSGELHQFKNTSEEMLEFICLIPHTQTHP